MGLNSNIRIINSTTCHCCSFDVFESIIESKSIRLCDMKNSNDPKEVTAAGEYILSLIEFEYKKTENEKYMFLKENFKKHLPEFNPYVASFTNMVDRIIFERYAEDGEGIGINFHSSDFGIGVYIVNDHKDIYYVPVIYDPQDSREYAVKVIEYYINGYISIEEVTLELLKISCMYKTKEWKEEKEIRIFYIPSEKKLLGKKHYFNKHNKIRSYYNLTFDKFDANNIIENIILGPNFNKEKITYINKILRNNELEYVKVYSYEEAYKESLEKKNVLGY